MPAGPAGVVGRRQMAVAMSTRTCVGILLGLVLAGCDGPGGPDTAGGGSHGDHLPPVGIKVKPFAIGRPDVVLLITGGTHGRLEICNCPGPQPGGLSRRSGLVISYRRTFGNVLLLDAGDFFWVKPEDPRNAYVLRGYRLIGYDAVVLGDHEWAALWGPLRRLLAGQPLGYLSTNARARGVRLPAQRAIVRRLGNVRVAVVSYLGPRTLWFPGGSADRLAVEGPEAVARRVAELKRQGCVVVLVAHAEAEELPPLGEIPDVDLIVRGNTARSEARLLRLGRTPMVRVGGADFVAAVAMKVRGGRIVAIDYRLEAVDLKWPEDPRLMSLFQAYAHEAMRASYDSARGLRLRYVRPEKCGRCHKAQYQAWRRGPHGRSWRALEAAGMTRQGDCLTCHTAGFGTATGFRSPRQTPGMAAVTCQECHRSNLQPHAQAPARHRPPPVIQDTCELCHTPRTSPRFNFKTYRLRIGCARVPRVPLKPPRRDLSSRSAARRAGP